MRAWCICTWNTASSSACSAASARRVSSTTISPAPASARRDDAIRRVVLLGRISLYGPGASRLHDEIIAVTARWIDPIARKGPLVPYAEDTEKLTLAALEKSFESARDRRVDEAVERKAAIRRAAGRGRPAPAPAGPRRHRHRHPPKQSSAPAAARRPRQCAGSSKTSASAFLPEKRR